MGMWRFSTLRSGSGRSAGHWTCADWRRREVADPGEQRLEFDTRVDAQQRVAVSEKRLIDRFPIFRGQILPRQRRK